MLAAGLQGDIEGCTARITPGISDGVDLGVVAPVAAMIALANYSAISYDQRTNHRVGTRLSQPPAGEIQGFSHVVFVIQSWFDLALLRNTPSVTVRS